MGNVIWQGDNAEVKQIATFTVVDTWATSDEGDLTCGGKTITFVVAATETPTAVAAGLVALWNASEEGAFQEVSAESAAAVITFTADTSGTPFAITSSETTAGDGTIGNQVDTTANDGAAVWDQATNWNTGAVPVDDDDVFVETTDNDIKWGLSQSGVTLDSLTFKQSFTGDCGLPEVNNEGNNEFVDYRDTYLAIEPDVCTIGEGEGDGSGRIKHDAGAVTCAWTVLNSGVRADPEIPAVLLKGTDGSNTLTVLKGDVGVAFFAGEVSELATLNVGYVTSPAGDSQVICGPGVTLTTINQTGGKLDIDLTTAAPTTINLDGGVLTLRGDTNGVTTINIAEGAKLIDMGGSGTIGTIHGRGEYDHSQSMTARTVTNFSLYPGYIYRDPHGVVTVSNGHDFQRCGPGQGGTFETKPHKTWTESAI